MRTSYTSTYDLDPGLSGRLSDLARLNVEELVRESMEKSLDEATRNLLIGNPLSTSPDWRNHINPPKDSWNDIDIHPSWYDYVPQYDSRWRSLTENFTIKLPSVLRMSDVKVMTYSKREGEEEMPKQPYTDSRIVTGKHSRTN